MSAATVLAHRINEEGVRLGEQWTNVLKQGGNRKGLDLYKMAGIDLSTTDIFNQAVDYVGAIVDELERRF
jgi:oligoendopeptidase F